MRKLASILLVLAIALTIMAAATPPPLPSSFYGYVTGVPVGQSINVYVNGVMVKVVPVRSYNGQSVYSTDLSMRDTNGVDIKDGTTATFKYLSQTIGTAAMHSGTNQSINLKYTAPSPVRRWLPFWWK